MAASLKRIRDTGRLVLVRQCEVCGADASFGFGVSLRLALKKLTEGDAVSARRHLGKWYCSQHKREADRL
jgi:hypothetical protein